MEVANEHEKLLRTQAMGNKKALPSKGNAE